MSARSWAGTTLQDRRATRREQLLAVGLELLGTEGSAAVSVRSVCRAAKLTDRYFYESFADREALLLAVYDMVAREAEQVLVDVAAAAPAGDTAGLARGAVEAFVDVLTADPRKGRVLLLEPLTDATLGPHSVAMSPAFVAVVRAQLADAPEIDAQLTAIALVGAMSSLFIRWLDGSLPVSRAVLCDYCVRLLVSGSVLAGG